MVYIRTILADSGLLTSANLARFATVYLFAAVFPSRKAARVLVAHQPYTLKEGPAFVPAGSIPPLSATLA